MNWKTFFKHREFHKYYTGGLLRKPIRWNSRVCSRTTSHINRYSGHEVLQPPVYDWWFLTPSKSKVLFLVILIVLTFVSSLGKTTSIMCIRAPCSQPFPSGNSVFITTNNVLAFPHLLIQEFAPSVTMESYSGGGAHYEFLGMDLGGKTNIIQPIKKIIDGFFFLLGAVLTVLYQYVIVSLVMNTVCAKNKRR